ncbi:hypothetical protein [Actinomycetospora sp. TBRC 11914]|uniref:hypothetical protein n=1 Tax=Actinomycetospora sp. TBRC 11914 TaxID=2729387 RepID=UPI00145E2E5D|nr:hypothetical protein [Actinomycetospora sp. TBRC 11914]NMO90349.1 hypothetical protein [Actinomycetospora sp. TBRC 11914]
MTTSTAEILAWCAFAVAMLALAGCAVLAESPWRPEPAGVTRTVRVLACVAAVAVGELLFALLTFVLTTLRIWS